MKAVDLLTIGGEAKDLVPGEEVADLLVDAEVLELEPPQDAVAGEDREGIGDFRQHPGEGLFERRE
jgi:hypothetical protein